MVRVHIEQQTDNDLSEYISMAAVDDLNAISIFSFQQQGHISLLIEVLNYMNLIIKIIK